MGRPVSLARALILAALLPGGGCCSTPVGSALSGRIRLDADPPRLPPLMVSEPACRARHPQGLADERFVTGPHHALANVFVYIDGGLPTTVPPVPTTPVRINQSGCRYEPHVFGIRVGQSLEIVNSDPVLHNIHALAKAGEPFNAAMPPRPQPWTITRVFTRPEVMVRIRCDVHGWMSAWAAAMPHPWFAVTDANGRFTLPPLPPGRYVLVAWHEACGTLRQSVLITPRAGPMVEFTFHVPDKI